VASCLAVRSSFVSQLVRLVRTGAMTRTWSARASASSTTSGTEATSRIARSITTKRRRVLRLAITGHRSRSPEFAPVYDESAAGRRGLELSDDRAITPSQRSGVSGFCAHRQNHWRGRLLGLTGTGAGVGWGTGGQAAMISASRRADRPRIRFPTLIRLSERSCIRSAPDRSPNGRLAESCGSAGRASPPLSPGSQAGQ
jgi:hypothetical protein